MAHLAYFDESGDTGLISSPTRFFILACVLVPELQWLASLDELVRMRRWLKNAFAIATRPEIKATDIKKARGPFKGRGMSHQRRMRILGGLMRFQAARLQNHKVFAIAIDKAKYPGDDVRATAWQYALQRVDRFCKAADSRAILFPDEGHGVFIKRLTRRYRRFQNISGAFGGTLRIPLLRVLEDPNDRQSHDSYFIQLADWNAYAAHRSQHVDPVAGVPVDLWDRLAGCLLLEVNAVRGGPPAIVRWP
jgi:hypothetical protein